MIRFYEVLLDGDKRALHEGLARADLNLPLKLFKKERSLLRLNSRIEIIQHQVVVEKHVEKEVAALFK